MDALQAAFKSRAEWEEALDVYAGQDGQDGYKDPSLVPKAEAEFKRAEVVSKAHACARVRSVRFVNWGQDGVMMVGDY